MEKTEKIKIGLVQASASHGLNENLEKTGKLISECSRKGANIVCLQELFATRYFAQAESKEFFKLAEKIPGKITNFLSDCAKKSNVFLIGGSLFEKGEGSKYYNTSLAFDKEGKVIGKYRKVHIPYDPKFYEQYYFSPGNLGFVQIKMDGIVISPLICYDQWYPEASRINTLKGASIIFYPTAIGWFKEMKRQEPWSARRWQDAMCAQASMNGIFVATANRVGKEKDMDFWGNSFIADPFGEVVAQASGKKEEALVAEIDLSKVKASQEGWGFLKNRKPKSYSELVK